MDADGTHNPKYIKNLLKFSAKYDLVSTNRFKEKNSLIEWPIQEDFLRKLDIF